MSGLVKNVRKVFSKVTKFVRKNWKPILMAAAVYFTAGIAMSYFGSTAAFASNMPGFGVGGIFSKAAVAIGFQGSSAVASGLSMTSGAFAAGTAAAGTIVPAGTLASEAAAVLTPVKAGAAKIAGGGEFIGSGFAGAGGKVAAGKLVAGADPGVAFMKAASSAFKLQAASTLIGTLGGLFKETPSETYEKQHALQWGQSFGVGREGGTESGWASTGGSEAFKDMGRPSGQQGGQQGSPFAKAMQTPTGPFLPTRSEAQGAPTMDGQNDFIQKGYGQQQGYMPYAT